MVVGVGVVVVQEEVLLGVSEIVGESRVKVSYERQKECGGCGVRVWVRAWVTVGV